MKRDVLAWAEGRGSEKHPSKESLNHPELVALASGLDPFRETPEAYRRAYEALGIDIINVVPEANAPTPLARGDVRLRDDGVMESYMGVYNTTARMRYPFETLEAFWAYDFAELGYGHLKLPSAQYMMPCEREAIETKMALVGEVGLYYYQLYTTVFMWGIEALGWETFMLAAGMEPERFDRHFLAPVFEKSKRIVTMLSELETPLVFCHDDIAIGTGAAFHPAWYDTYIFPRMAELWEIVHGHGKKVILVSDGKLEWALEKVRGTGADGVMFETPTTSLEAVMDVFGDGFFIGGIDARVLTFGTPEEVKRHVHETVARVGGRSGFALCCSAGLNGDIPLKNAKAYFDARVEHRFTPRGWRERYG